MNYTELCRKLINAEKTDGNRLYDEHEAKSVARVLLEDMFDLGLTDIYNGALEKLTDDQQLLLTNAIERLLSGEPIQYVTGKALFFGRYFAVRPGVLIPRPETEELCQWIIDENEDKKQMLDIGTGSGCIAITLALETRAKVTAWDISDIALEIAKENSERLKATVEIKYQDAMQTCPEGQWDVIVSNPPYICEKEKATMESNVLDYEPSLALFVPDNNPLKFYRTIAKYASSNLTEDGHLYFEINPIYKDDMESMLFEEGFEEVIFKTDFCGKQRMVRASKQCKQRELGRENE